MSENTTVIVSKETRDALKALKRGGESYDAVIRRLIVSYVKPIFGALAGWMQLRIVPLLEAEE